MDDKRKFARIDIKTDIRILSDNDFFSTNCSNISACGLLLKSDKSLEIGTIINVKVIDPKSVAFHEMDAEVVRVEKIGEENDYQIGIKFIDMDKVKVRELGKSFN